MIFISYAVEDVAFSDWLALKLTSAGYRVWYDRMSLLAGRSWVKEVDEAIATRSFRVLALLSRHSINKDNPIGERTKAQAVGKKLGIEDFIITLNVDGLPSAEIPWTLSQKSYASFHPSWADGLTQLLKTLAAIQAPRDETLGRDLVCQWLSAKDQPSARAERVWTNVIPVLSVPAALRQYEVHDPDMAPMLQSRWACAVETRGLVWSFEEPPADLASEVTFNRATSWTDLSGDKAYRVRNAAKYLLRRAITDYCLKRGLKYSEQNKLLYFPPGLLESDKHFFVGLYGKRTYVKMVGQSTFRVGLGEKELNRHHLAPCLSLVAHSDGTFYLRLTNRLFITSMDGTPIHPTRMNRRRKKICKNWWNDKWGSRLLAVTSWLSQDKENIEILKAPGGTFSIAGKPLSLTSVHGIFEGEASEPVEIDDAFTPEIDDRESAEPIRDLSDAGEEEEITP